MTLCASPQEVTLLTVIYTCPSRNQKMFASFKFNRFGNWQVEETAETVITKGNDLKIDKRATKSIGIQDLLYDIS